MNEFHAEVLDIRDEGTTEGRRRFQLLLTASLFKGPGGILVSIARSGARLEVPILGVVVEKGELWHIVEKPLAAGTPVTGHVPAAVEQTG